MRSRLRCTNACALIRPCAPVGTCVARVRLAAHKGGVPNLRVISCWTDASSRLAVPAAPRVCSGRPHSRQRPVGHGRGSLCAPRGARLLRGRCDFAFLRIMEKTRRNAWLLHELEANHEYSALLTTGGGLYRYRLGDRVRVVGFARNTPLLEFLGKEDAHQRPLRRKV